jgi:glyoxylase-like metal-dependent hydrolase (beta-lactamase superfamily II)
MILEHFLLPLIETNCYIFACAATRQAALIDPGEWNQAMAQFLRRHELNLRWILLTHGHSDHTDGMSSACSATGATVAASKLNPAALRKLSDGEDLELGNLKIRVLEVPGHTPDSLAFTVGNKLFSGDALFAGSVGGTPDSVEHERLINSIRTKILLRGDDVVVFPGHGPATTVKIERLFNPFLKE